MKRQQDNERILEEFKGVRNIPRVKTAKKRVLIKKIKNKKGECITSRKGIAVYLWRILQMTTQRQ